MVRFGMLERSKEETAAEEQRLQQAASQLRQQIQALAQNLQVAPASHPQPAAAAEAAQAPMCVGWDLTACEGCLSVDVWGRLVRW